MTPAKSIRHAAKVARWLLHIVAKPGRAGAGSGGYVVQAYRGYGSRREAVVGGRVFRGPAARTDAGSASVGRDMRDVLRRIFRTGVPRAKVAVRFGGAEDRVIADRSGFFRARLRLSAPIRDGAWHELDIRLVSPTVGTNGIPAKARGAFWVPPDGARFVVVSDIDDTVMDTGVANKIKMLWRLFVQGPASRVAFPGVAAFYRALHQGADDAPVNPMVYVSRAPWGIYEVLDAFFRLHRIPIGPILFLRDWGVTIRRPIPKRGRGHKLGVIREILSFYADRPFVLIGDSGQHDPEIYARVVREYPNRVKAIYIRNVSRGADRRRAIEILAREVAAAGSSLVLTSDTFAMARHAADHGLISPDELAAVLAERVAQDQSASIKPTRRIPVSTPERTAVEAGRAATGAPASKGEPPNVAIEPARRRDENGAPYG